MSRAGDSFSRRWLSGSDVSPAKSNGMKSRPREDLVEPVVAVAADPHPADPLIVHRRATVRIASSRSHSSATAVATGGGAGCPAPCHRQGLSDRGAVALGERPSVERGERLGPEVGILQIGCQGTVQFGGEPAQRLADLEVGVDALRQPGRGAALIRRSGWRRTEGWYGTRGSRGQLVVEETERVGEQLPGGPSCGTYSWSRATVLASGPAVVEGAEHGREGVE